MKYNLLNQKFSLLTVISLAPREKWGPNGKSTSQHWLCKCDCGGEKIIRGTHLIRGDTISCGCVRKKKRYEHHNWTGYEEISGNFLYSVKAHAKQRHIPFNISIKYMWEIFLKQNRKCALSNLELTFQSHARDRNGTASLDRINNDKGYVKGNIQWLHKDINQMKMDFTEKQLMEYCKLICQTKKLL